MNLCCKSLSSDSERTNMAAPITCYRSTNMVIIKVFKPPNTTSNITSLINSFVAAVCHMTSMTRRHGNNKVIHSKITVA